MIQQKKSDKEWKILFFFFSYHREPLAMSDVYIWSVDVKCIFSLAVNIYELS